MSNGVIVCCIFIVMFECSFLMKIAQPQLVNHLVLMKFFYCCVPDEY